MKGFSIYQAINNQYACKSIIEAEERFKESCDMCCNSPQCLWRSCDSCKLAQLHEAVIEQLKAHITVGGDNNEE